MSTKCELCKNARLYCVQCSRYCSLFALPNATCTPSEVLSASSMQRSLAVTASVISEVPTKRLLRVSCDTLWLCAYSEPRQAVLNACQQSAASAAASGMPCNKAASDFYEMLSDLQCCKQGYGQYVRSQVIAISGSICSNQRIGCLRRCIFCHCFPVSKASPTP